MKGTARAQPAAEGDSETARWLEGDAKNRAENLMIVDLLRNDLGRIARHRQRARAGAVRARAVPHACCR